jgi:FkbM family methyltransferase
MGVFNLFRRDKLIRLDGFEMWVDGKDEGVGAGLIKRSKRMAEGKEPGPEREPDFNFLIRSEMEELGGRFRERQGRLTIIDLGANFGLNTIIMSRALGKLVDPQRYRIYAIEPNRANGRLLEKNIQLNKVSAEYINCAISDYTGEGRFHGSTHSNLGALMPHAMTGGQGESVKVFSLPDFAATFKTGSPNFIKMDIEGGEVEVLKGARKFLAGAEPPCVIIMEVHPMIYTGERSLEVELRHLFDSGWRGKYMTSAAVVQPDKFREAGLKPFREFDTGRFSRGVYRDFSKEQLLDFACHKHIQEVPGKKPSEKIVRAIVICKD